jgi:hypothetical protein
MNPPSRPAIGRRGLGLAALSAGLAAGFSRPAHAQRAARGTRRTVHLNTGLLRDPQLGPVTGPTSFALAMRLEDEPVALRIGFGNDIALDYALASVAACVSTSYADGINPAGGAPWTLLTTNGGGRDGPEAGQGGQARGLTVPGNGGGPRVPALAWTDWCPIRSVPPEDGSGRPILFVRVAAPPWSAPRACDAPRGFSGTPAAAGRDIAAHMCVDNDHATAPGPRVGGFRPWEATPVYCVQYMSRTRGVTVLWGGDSQFAGTATPGNIDSFALQTCLALSTAAMPVAAANYAWSGSPSILFLPLLERMLEACRPQIVLLQGFTGNDGPNPEGVQAYAARIMQLAARAQALGTLPVLLTRFPRASLAQNPALALLADQLRERQLHQNRPGLPVLDATLILEDPSEPGIYRSGLSADRTHPNQTGHAALAQALTALLKPLL